jgi:hypothetical protein
MATDMNIKMSELQVTPLSVITPRRRHKDEDKEKTEED